MNVQKKFQEYIFKKFIPGNCLKETKRNLQTVKENKNKNLNLTMNLQLMSLI